MERQNSLSDDDFLRMQQEAIRRVREMQSRARATLENAGMYIENNDEPAASRSAAAAESTSRNETSKRPQTGSQSTDQPGVSHSGSGNQSNHSAPHFNAQSDSTRGDGTHRSGEPRPDTPHHGATRPGNPHENGRPEEGRSEHWNEPPVIHTPGLNIDIEGDQLMLLLTLYLLIKDGADKWLILSIAYVMLS